MARAIKYLLNLAGLVLMWWIALLSYALIVRIPPCSQISGLVSERLREYAYTGLIYLCVLTLINWLIQRKFERRPRSKEYLYLGAINLVLIILFAWYHTNRFIELCDS